MESKADKFQRLAEARVNKAISSIRSVGKLANRSHYEFSRSDVRKIFTALREELDEAKGGFDASLQKTAKKSFQLKE